MLSFCQEEAGHYGTGWKKGNGGKYRETLKTIWGIHAVAHAFEMQNKFKQGADFMQELEVIGIMTM